MSKDSPARRAVIQSLSALVSEKRQRLQMLGMMNTAADEAERMRQSMAYSQAQAEMLNAENALRSYIAKEEHQ